MAMTAGEASAIGAVLQRLRQDNPDIQACVVATEDGFLVAGQGAPDVNAELLAALAADLLSRASRSAREFGQGALNEIYAHGERGYVIVARAGEGQVLAALAAPGATLGLLLIDIRRTASEIATVAAAGQEAPSTPSPQPPQSPQQPAATDRPLQMDE